MKTFTGVLLSLTACIVVSTVSGQIYAPCPNTRKGNKFKLRYNCANLVYINCCLFMIFMTSLFQLNVETTGGVTVTAVAIPGCSAPPCKLPRGTNQTVTVTFTASRWNVLFAVGKHTLPLTTLIAPLHTQRTSAAEETVYLPVCGAKLNCY